MMDRDELLEQLEHLVASEFEEVLYHANIPLQYLRDDSQTDRAIDALRYLESHGQLDRLLPILNELHNKRRRNAETAPGELTATGDLSRAAQQAPVAPRRTSPDLDSAASVLRERLENARARQEALYEAGVAMDEVQQEILDLRRQLRDGGQPRTGDVLCGGRYLLIKRLGRGGFAVVWEGRERDTRRHVALKVLHGHLAGEAQRRERFFRGARVMMASRHPAIVRVLDVGSEQDGLCYFVMELVPGGDLREAVLARRIGQDRLLPLILQIGEALGEAHRQQLTHRDIKPSNILLDEHGNAKLTDFDLVSACDTTGGTRTGALGTVVYAAPECLDRPSEATARADVFGLGMTAIFCLSGQDLSLQTFRNSEAAVRRLACSRAVQEVLAQAVAWEPERRFADATEMVEALRRAVYRVRLRTTALGTADLRTAESHTANENRETATLGGSGSSGEGLPQRVKRRGFVAIRRFHRIRCRALRGGA